MIPYTKTIPNSNDNEPPKRGHGGDDDEGIDKTLKEIFCVIGMMISLIISFIFIAGTIILNIMEFIKTDFEDLGISFWPNELSWVIPPTIFLLSLLAYFIVDKNRAIECLKYVFWND